MLLSIFPELSAAELKGGECWLQCNRIKLIKGDQNATMIANLCSQSNQP